MARPDNPLPTQLERDLADLKLLEIARCYREVLDDAARKGSSMLEVLNTLIGMEQALRQQVESVRGRTARIEAHHSAAGDIGSIKSKLLKRRPPKLIVGSWSGSRTSRKSMELHACISRLPGCYRRSR